MEPSRQVQQYLPGLGSNYKPQIKEPHQMTPDEFDSHPYAVFHASRASASELAERPFLGTDRNYRDPEVQPMHVGTEKSAVERAGSAFYAPDNQNRTSPWKMHTFWAVPRKEEIQRGAQYFDDHRVPLSVYEKKQKPRVGNIGKTYDSNNDPGDPEAFADHLGYYVNGIEDLGSVSMATRRPDTRYQTHADFVRKAIDSGKGDEVHPLTMAMYKQGKLSQGREITEDEAMHARRTSKNYLSNMSTLDTKYEELERQENRRRSTTGQAMFDFSDYDNTAGKRGVRGEPDGVARSGYFTVPTEEYPTPHGGLTAPGTVYGHTPMAADTLMQVTPEPEIPEPTHGPNLSRIRKQRKLDRYKNY
jgi:hypothetical protein